MAEVRVEIDKSANNVFVMLQADEGQVAQCTKDQTALVVPGKYRLWTMSYQGGTGNRTGFMSASQDPQKPPFDLKAGKNTLKFGPPLTIDFTATYANGAVAITTVKIAGQAGELYRPNIMEQQGDSFASYVSAGGKEIKLAALRFT